MASGKTPRKPGQRASKGVTTPKTSPKRVIPISKDGNSFESELRYAGDRSDLERRILRLWSVLEQLHLDEMDRRLVEIGRGEKKNFAQRFSTALAQKTAEALRPDFEGIQPSADGVGHESLSKSASGLKKIDVNYSSRRSGLELAVSIKTINFKDEGTGRYTKNTKRVDGELRAEAEDVHRRQPYAVLVAYLFLPADAADDGKAGISSLKHNATVLAMRSGRVDIKNDLSRIELAFVGLYTDDGKVAFYHPESIPANGVPAKSLKFSDTIALVRDMHTQRNPSKR